ncbi:MAG: hypothetical protein AB1689_24690 [Thermodesulfobacteriota bacterium]
MRNRRSLTVVALAAVVTLASPEGASAAPNGPAEKSLDRCQGAVRTEGAKYASSMQKAIGACLGKISGEVLKKNAGVAAAVAACTAQFDKIARTDGKSLGDVFTAKVAARCSPAPDNAHTLEDLTGSGFPGFAEPLRARDVSAVCTRYGIGFVDSASKWADCVRRAQECAVHDAVAAQFPRAIAWLNDLAAAMPPSPARDAVLASERALDGTWDDGRPEGGCSVEVPAPGCPESLLARQPDEVMDDLRAALAAEDWDAVACSYHPNAFVVDDQGVLVGPQEIVGSLMSLAALADGAQPVVHEETFFDDVVRVLFSLDAGWWRIQDGASTYVVRRGRIVQQTTHGLIDFTGPPPEED